ncbi:MAG: hypothetical protein MK101_00770 [Phycisphaerales bacterium]|nr:hypothetical protein [Phycisphaerales bacterium]
MRREGTNPDDVQPEDVLCDFCHQAAWAEDVPCVEGHHGSIICGECLQAAWVAHDRAEKAEDSRQCTMCLEQRDDAIWSGSASDACICGRCIRQAAGALHKSKDWSWTKPDG